MLLGRRTRPFAPTAVAVLLAACAAPADRARVAPEVGVPSRDEDAGIAMIDAAPPLDDDARSDTVASDSATDAAAADAADASPPGASLLLAEANRELRSLTASAYTHDTFVDESRGIFNYDCSGFATYALGRALPDALRTLEAAAGTTRPNAAEFEKFFASLATISRGRWRPVG